MFRRSATRTAMTHAALAALLAVPLLALVPATAERAEPDRAASMERRAPAPHRAARVKVTVLSTMLAGNPQRGVGEWGFAALVEVDGRRLLFDTGARPDVVLKNARELGVDLAGVTDVVLSHNHADHVGGLVTLRTELARSTPAALRTAHVARGIFWPRPRPAGGDGNGLALLRVREGYEAAGGRFVEHDGPVQLLPGVWLTGPVPRTHPERNFPADRQVRAPSGLAEDNIPEDAALVIDTPDGLVVITGCGHAGIVNTLQHARAVVREAPIHAAIGGLHLLGATDEQVAWTGARMRELGTAHLLAAHCTGIEATYQLRAALGLTRRTAVVSAVGSTFTLGAGIEALALAR